MKKMNYKKKESQGFNEIKILIELEDIAKKALRDRQIHSIETIGSNFKIEYDTENATTCFTYTLIGKDDRKV